MIPGFLLRSYQEEYSWWIIGMIQESSRQMPLECDVNIAVNGCSGFVTNPTRPEGNRLNRFQGNSFAFRSSREQIKHSLPTLSGEPLQAHSTFIFAFYYRNQTSLCYCFAAQPVLSVPDGLPYGVWFATSTKKGLFTAMISRSRGTYLIESILEVGR